MNESFNIKSISLGATKRNASIRPISEEELKKLQICLYNMAVDLDERRRKHGIKLFLVGGSLLGDGGFISWDDDMDWARRAMSEYSKFNYLRRNS